MSGTLAEVGRIVVNDSFDNDTHIYPMAMLITFDNADELQAAISARSVDFSLFSICGDKGEVA
jgi:hypothetical protein